MRLAVAVEVLVLARPTVARSLPQLAQVRIDIAVVVIRAGETMRQSPTTTGTLACGRLGAGVARPHQPVLLIVAEVGGFAAACIAPSEVTLLLISSRKPVSELACLYLDIYGR